MRRRLKLRDAEARVRKPRDVALVLGFERRNFIVNLIVVGRLLGCNGINYCLKTGTCAQGTEWGSAPINEDIRICRDATRRNEDEQCYEKEWRS